MTAPLRLACSLLAIAVLAVPLAAQQAVGRAISLSGGVSSFDARGTGNAPMGHVRVERPLVGSWLLGEAGLGYARLEEQLTTSPTHLGILEAQVQLQLPAKYVRPYLGLGVGSVSYLSHRDGRDLFEESASIAAGARIPLTESVGFRGELRVRGWRFHGIESGFSAAAAETTFGLSFAF